MFRFRNKGATMAEMGLLVGLIAVLLIGSLTSVGKNLSTLFGETQGVLNRALPGNQTPHIHVSGATTVTVGTQSLAVSVSDGDGVSGVIVTASGETGLSNIQVSGTVPNVTVTYDIAALSAPVALTITARDPEGHETSEVVSLTVVQQSSYASCQDVYDEGWTEDGTYPLDLTGAGSPTDRFCLMSREGGGWTEITAVDQSFGYVWTHSIPDIGLDYTELFFIAEADQHTDYAVASDPAWDADGFAGDRMVYVVGGSYYMTESCGSMGACASFTSYNIIPSTYVSPLPTTQCYAGSSTTGINSCALEMRMTIPSGQKLTSVTDVESITGNSNNGAYFHYTLYGR